MIFSQGVRLDVPIPKIILQKTIFLRRITNSNIISFSPVILQGSLLLPPEYNYHLLRVSYYVWRMITKRTTIYYDYINKQFDV